MPMPTRILLVDYLLAILSKNRQSPKFTPCQNLVLHGMLACGTTIIAM